MNPTFSLFLLSVAVMLPPFAAYSIGMGTAATPLSRRFPAPREIAALLVIFLYTGLAGRITGGFLSYVYTGIAGMVLLVWFGIFLPAFAAGVAGRRPFLYGGAAAIAYWFWTAVFIRLAFVGREWMLSPSWLMMTFAEIPFLTAFCLWGVLPLYRNWRRRQFPTNRSSERVPE